MIKFDELVAAIERSALAAAEALAVKNLEIFDRFFEDADEAPDLAPIEAAAREATRGLEGGGDHEEAREALRKAAAAVEATARALRQRPSGVRRPKYATIQYPHLTKDGPEVHTVLVPLLTLAPIAFAQLTELRFKTELDLSLEDDQLKVGLPATPRSGDGPGKAEAEGAAPAPRSTLEIVIGEAPSSQGLRLIVDGYNRALRAQIPG